MNRLMKQGVLTMIAAAFALGSAKVESAHAQLRGLIKTAACAGGAGAGIALGKKIAEYEVKKQGLAGQQAKELTQGLIVGTSLIMCGVTSAAAGTVYENLSKKDLDARKKEMEAALADVKPTPRAYQLPDSKLNGSVTAQAPTMDGDEECRLVYDQLAEKGEPAVTKYCRKPGGNYSAVIR